MASDENILDELHFLSRKMESLEKKLDTSLAIQEDLAANFLQEGKDSLHKSLTHKLDPNDVSGSCLEWSRGNDEINRSHADETNLKQPTNEHHEHSTSYLIIPVGSYKHNDSCSLQTVKQTFTWFEMDHNAAPNYVRRQGQLKSDKKDTLEILECHANQYEAGIPGISNTVSSFATQASLLNQSRLGLPERQMCTQWNGNKSDEIAAEECLPYTSRAVCKPHTKERTPGKMSDNGKYAVENMSDGNAKLVHGSSSLKYGLTIGIATAKASAAYRNPKYNEISSQKFVELEEEHYNMLRSRLEEGKVMKKETSIDQLRPLWTKESKIQSTPTSDQNIFDRIFALSSMQQDGETETNSGCNERLDYFSPATDVCYIEEDNRLSYPVVEVDSEISQHDQTNRGFVDTYAQDLLTVERNGSSLHSNHRSDASVQTLRATKAQSKQVEMDFQEPDMNRKYGDDYSADVEKTTKNGNYRFKQSEVHCDALTDNVIQMQISSVAEVQIVGDDCYAQESYQADNSFINNKYFKGINARDQRAQILSAQHHREALRTKPSGRKIEHDSHFGDQVRGIVGTSDNNYKAIKRGSEGRAKVKTRRKIAPATTRHVQHAKNIGVPTKVPMSFADDITFETSRKKPQEERYAHIETDEAVYQSPCKDEFDFSPDILTESGFSETLISPGSDDVFFTYPNEAQNSSADYDVSSKEFSTPNRIGRCDASESESPYSSSLTSVSSTNEVIYPRERSIDARSQFSEYDGKRIGSENEIGGFQSSGSHLPSPPSKASKKESPPFHSKPLVGSFRLSSLPRLHQGSKLYDTPTRHTTGRVSSFRTQRVSSPTSSVDTSELSMGETVCECQCPCECQTGIPTVEDFKEELKTISKHVLNARKQSATGCNRLRPSYYVDEEHGEKEILEGCLQSKDNEAVPMLVKVILRLRKHFFGSLDSKPPFPAKYHSDINNNNNNNTNNSNNNNNNNNNTPHTVEPDNTTGKPQRTRKISFSPSAMLLGAIGENSAAEVKAVIEKENIDVNQLSPSGRSLLHKAAAAGDLESIHTLIQYGAVVNIADQDGYPPIHSALMKAHFKCAILLIECGTDLARYTAARVQEFLDISDMTTEHSQVVLKTDL